MTDNKRFTIGIILDALHASYQADVWRGLVERAKERDINLVTFIGTTQEENAYFDSNFEERIDNHYEFLADFVAGGSIDAVILISCPIANAHGNEFVKQLCARFTDIPILCVSEPVPNYHSIVVDNRSGVEATIAHLVNIHNLRNIAFIKGPEDHAEADERFDAYKHGLEVNHLMFRPELVLSGGFTSRHGTDAVKKLLADHVEFDAIVAANDHAAFGAMEELSQNGILVPTDVALIGFDDVVEASKVQPSLSTVRQPVHDLGRMAIDSIWAQLVDEPVEFNVMVPTMPVYRRSCGCFSEVVQHSRSPQQKFNGLSSEEVVAHLVRTALTNARSDAPGYPGDGELIGMIGNLVDSLNWDVQRPVIRHIFLNEIDMLLHRCVEFSIPEQFMNAMLLELTMYVSSLFNSAEHQGEANRLLQQAGTFIREQLAHSGHGEQTAKEEFTHRVAVVKQQLISSFKSVRIIDAICEGLPALGIASLCISLFDSPMSLKQWQCPDDSRVFVAYAMQRSGKLQRVAGGRLSYGQFFPENLSVVPRFLNRIFIPLHFENTYIGYAVIEHSEDCYFFIYEELRAQLSAVIAANLMFEKNIVL